MSGAGAAVGNPTEMVCEVCGAGQPVAASQVCEECWGPLGFRYDLERVRAVWSPETLAARPASLWRYGELLPLGAPPSVGLATGMTPLVRADRLGQALGIRELWLKNEGVCHPSLSFKDRTVAVAVNKAKELGLSTVACASTGNLANATAALAAAAGLRAVVLVPEDVEPAKIVATTVYGAKVVAIRGTYDEASRLCSEIAGRYGFGVVNVNLRPFFAEGSKTVGFEIAEQLGWRLPAATVVPMAGGSLLAKIHQAYKELVAVGLVPQAESRLFGAQAAGCAPIADMIIEGRDEVRPIREPRTIARSIAVGDPGDAVFARQAILTSGGFAATATDDQIVAGMRLLAETEGIFGETAAGVVLEAARRLVGEGRIGPESGPVVLCLTGQGLKTQDPLLPVLPKPSSIAPNLSAFAELWARELQG